MERRENEMKKSVNEKKKKIEEIECNHAVKEKDPPLNTIGKKKKKGINQLNEKRFFLFF